MYITPISQNFNINLGNFQNKSHVYFMGIKNDEFIKSPEEKMPLDILISKTQFILEKAGIECEIDKESGLLNISHYNGMVAKILRNHKKISEDNIFQVIHSIRGLADFKGSTVTNLGNLMYIFDDAYFDGSKVTNLGELKIIDGDARFSNSWIKNLGNLEYINGTAYFQNSHVYDLGKLKCVLKGAYTDNSPLRIRQFKGIKCHVLDCKPPQEPEN